MKSKWDKFVTTEEHNGVKRKRGNYSLKKGTTFTSAHQIKGRVAEVEKQKNKQLD